MKRYIQLSMFWTVTVTLAFGQGPQGVSQAPRATPEKYPFGELAAELQKDPLKSMHLVREWIRKRISRRKRPRSWPTRRNWPTRR